MSEFVPGGFFGPGITGKIPVIILVHKGEYILTQAQFNERYRGLDGFKEEG